MLIGLEGNQAFIWDIYSKSVKPGKRIQGDDGYNFYESIVDVIRPGVKRGVKSILVAATRESDYRNFMGHIRKHQGWLLGGWNLNTVSFEHINEPAVNTDQVRDLVQARGFKEKLTKVYQEDLQQVTKTLEKRLNDPKGIETLLFSLKEVENAVYGNEKRLEYILITELYRSKNWRRTHRLLQVAANKNIKTRIIKSETPTGARITQFGGLICML
jgi:stalled ribosome rescue protein Dom34